MPDRDGGPPAVVELRPSAHRHHHLRRIWVDRHDARSFWSVGLGRDHPGAPQPVRGEEVAEAAGSHSEVARGRGALGERHLEPDLRDLRPRRPQGVRHRDLGRPARRRHRRQPAAGAGGCGRHRGERAAAGWQERASGQVATGPRQLANHNARGSDFVRRGYKACQAAIPRGGGKQAPRQGLHDVREFRHRWRQQLRAMLCCDLGVGGGGRCSSGPRHRRRCVGRSGLRVARGEAAEGHGEPEPVLSGAGRGRQDVPPGPEPLDQGASNHAGERHGLCRLRDLGGAPWRAPRERGGRFVCRGRGAEVRPA
mmetsp:Transcript_120086/g.383339  ORF Transcript_120086/g.383339 Transcript_120086/m.383339 type:complete len:310 (+) Transcript_120086:1320-2249(+)